jgi:hypothetical protein
MELAAGMAAAISLAPTTPALPEGKPPGPRAEPVAQTTSGALCRGRGAFLRSRYGIAPAGDPGHSLPLVALVPQWRQDYPNVWSGRQLGRPLSRQWAKAD